MTFFNSFYHSVLFGNRATALMSEFPFVCLAFFTSRATQLTVLYCCIYYCTVDLPLDLLNVCLILAE